MEEVKYTQNRKIEVPTYEFYCPEGESANERFSLTDAKDVLNRWGLQDGESVDPKLDNFWTSEMKSMYQNVIATPYDGLKVNLINKIIATHIQSQFSGLILDSLSGDCNLITELSYQAYSKYLMRDNVSKGIVSLQEPPQQYIDESTSNLDFKIKSTEEVDLNKLVKKTEDYVMEHWDFPIKK